MHKEAEGRLEKTEAKGRLPSEKPGGLLRGLFNAPPHPTLGSFNLTPQRASSPSSPSTVLNTLTPLRHQEERQGKGKKHPALTAPGTIKCPCNSWRKLQYATQMILSSFVYQSTLLSTHLVEGSLPCAQLYAKHFRMGWED